MAMFVFGGIYWSWRSNCAGMILSSTAVTGPENVDDGVVVTCTFVRFHNQQEDVAFRSRAGYI